MSTVNQDELKALKVLKFTGKESEWDHWSAMFVALVRARGFAGILLGSEKAPRADKEIDRKKDDDSYVLTDAERKEKTQAGQWKCITHQIGKVKASAFGKNLHFAGVKPSVSCAEASWPVLGVWCYSLQGKGPTKSLEVNELRGFPLPLSLTILLVLNLLHMWDHVMPKIQNFMALGIYGNTDNGSKNICKTITNLPGNFMNDAF